MSLEKDLNEFRDITVELMDRIEYQGNRLLLMHKREEIINKIRNSDYNAAELKKICESLKIDEIDEELKRRVLNQMAKINMEIKTLKKSYQGNQAYLSSGYGSGSAYSRFDKTY